MSAFVDFTGRVFGRLKVLKLDHTKPHKPRGRYFYWLCECICGNQIVVAGSALRSGHTQSCGCLQKERAILASTTHGMSGTKYHRLWKNIKNRCYNENFKRYDDWGGRGIKMYAPWIDNFQLFFDYISGLEHFGEAGRSLDRIENDKGYEPGNLRWATPTEQGRNQRTNHLVEYQGELMTIAEAAEKSGIKRKVLEHRIRRGDTGERLFRPIEEKFSNKKS